VGEVTVRRESVRAADCRVVQAVATCASSQQCVGDRAIKVVDDGYWCSAGIGLDVGRQSDALVCIENDVRPADILGELSAANCRYSCGRDGSPTREGIRDERVRIRTLQERAEVSLIGVKRDGSTSPCDWLSRQPSIKEAGPGNILRSARFRELRK
jgi:hypothetical protein